jgi:hypothetical protein
MTIDKPELLEVQIARSCELNPEFERALLDEAIRCGWAEPDTADQFRDWIYAYNAF